MKKAYKKLIKLSNAVEPAAPASVWGKGCAGKGGKTTNSLVGDTMFHREMKEKGSKEV